MENLSSLSSWAPSPRQGDSHEGEKWGRPHARARTKIQESNL